jgi:DNA processing protein
MSKKDKVMLPTQAMKLARAHALKELRPSSFRRLVRQTLPNSDDLFTDYEAVGNQLRNKNIEVHCRSDDEWHKGLNVLKDPPVLLYRQGFPITRVPILGVVGSRSECPYAKNVARSVVQKWSGLYPHGRIISGGGLGVDAAAWRAALDFGLAPIMVLAHGLGKPHIEILKELYWRTTKEGTLLSEAIPLSRPIPGMFPDRNRLIAAIADVLVVVRGARRSGSLHTLNIASKLNKKVFGVVGPIDDPGWFGIHDAIRTKKVRPLFHLDDLQDEECFFEAPDDAMESIQPNPQEALVLKALRKKPLAIDDLASILGLTAAPTMRLLLPLEIRGWIQRTSEGRFRISQCSKARIHMAR